MLNRRIAYSEVFGEAPVGNPPFSSVFLCSGFEEPGPGRQIVFREVQPKA